MLSLHNITKRYGSLTANQDISLSIGAGSIHCLLGENGAGKTTLMNVLYGLSSADDGEIRLNGVPVQFESPKDAIAARIGMVHQHFMLIPAFTVTENVMLGMEETLLGDRLDFAKGRQRVTDLSSQFGLTIDPDAKIEGMPVGLQQKVEIVKVLYRSADVLIFDEPTSVLTPQEVSEFFKIIRSLKAAGKAILFITHKLHEVMEVADEITVLRLGKVVGHVLPQDISMAHLATMMVGRPVSMSIARKEVQPGDVVLSLKNVSVLNENGIRALNDVSLDLREGEIIGIAGVHGNGQTELINCICGMSPVADGAITVCGKDLAAPTPRERHQQGLAHIPEDRSNSGVVTPLSVAENLVLDSYYEPRFSRRSMVDWQSVKTVAKQLVAEFDVRTSSIDAPASSLSGGNQQKIVVAREMSRSIKVLVAGQPTRGVDVGSIEYVHKRILEARDQNVGVLLVSTELDEILALSDRILVMFDGHIIAEFDGVTVDRSELGLAMAGATTFRSASEVVQTH